MEKIRVLIADDHALVREGLSKILSMEERIEIVGEASNGEQAISQVFACKPDIVLMDINMPVINGIAATRMIKSERPETDIIILTIHDQEEYLFELIKAGVSGYMLKDVSPDLLIQTILGVARGESFLPSNMVARMFEEYARLANLSTPEGLTRREIDVLRLVAQGHSNRIIAEKLYISEKTVKNHLTNIFLKLGVDDRTQAAIHAIKNNMVNS